MATRRRGWALQAVPGLEPLEPREVPAVLGFDAALISGNTGSWAVQMSRSSSDLGGLNLDQTLGLAQLNGNDGRIALGTSLVGPSVVGQKNIPQLSWLQVTANGVTVITTALPFGTDDPNLQLRLHSAIHDVKFASDGTLHLAGSVASDEARLDSRPSVQAEGSGAVWTWNVGGAVSLREYLLPGVVPNSIAAYGNLRRLSEGGAYAIGNYGGGYLAFADFGLDTNGAVNTAVSGVTISGAFGTGFAPGLILAAASSEVGAGPLIGWIGTFQNGTVGNWTEVEHFMGSRDNVFAGNSRYVGGVSYEVYFESSGEITSGPTLWNRDGSLFRVFDEAPYESLGVRFMDEQIAVFSYQDSFGTGSPGMNYVLTFDVDPTTPGDQMQFESAEAYFARLGFDFGTDRIITIQDMEIANDGLGRNWALQTQGNLVVVHETLVRAGDPGDGGDDGGDPGDGGDDGGDPGDGGDDGGDPGDGGDDGGDPGDGGDDGGDPGDGGNDGGGTDNGGTDNGGNNNGGNNGNNGGNNGGTDGGNPGNGTPGGNSGNNPGNGTPGGNSGNNGGNGPGGNSGNNNSGGGNSGNNPGNQNPGTGNPNPQPGNGNSGNTPGNGGGNGGGTVGPVANGSGTTSGNGGSNGGNVGGHAGGNANSNSGGAGRPAQASVNSGPQARDFALLGVYVGPDGFGGNAGGLPHGTPTVPAPSQGQGDSRSGRPTPPNQEDPGQARRRAEQQISSGGGGGTIEPDAPDKPNKPEGGMFDSWRKAWEWFWDTFRMPRLSLLERLLGMVMPQAEEMRRRPPVETARNDGNGKRDAASAPKPSPPPAVEAEVAPKQDRPADGGEVNNDHGKSGQLDKLEPSVVDLLFGRIPFFGLLNLDGTQPQGDADGEALVASGVEGGE